MVQFEHIPTVYTPITIYVTARVPVPFLPIIISVLLAVIAIIRFCVSSTISGLSHTPEVEKYLVLKVTGKAVLYAPARGVSYLPHCRIPEQWGNSSVTTENTDGTLIYYPIAFKYNVFGVVATDRGGGCYSWGASEYNINNFRAWARNVGVFTLATGAWFSVGR